MKSSPSIWQYVVRVKSTVKIWSIFVAYLENKNFTIPGIVRLKLSYIGQIPWYSMVLCLLFFSKNSLSKNWFYVFSTTPCLNIMIVQFPESTKFVLLKLWS